MLSSLERNDGPRHPGHRAVYRGALAAAFIRAAARKQREAQYERRQKRKQLFHRRPSPS